MTQYSVDQNGIVLIDEHGRVVGDLFFSLIHFLKSLFGKTEEDPYKDCMGPVVTSYRHPPFLVDFLGDQLDQLDDEPNIGPTEQEEVKK